MSAMQKVNGLAHELVKPVVVSVITGAIVAVASYTVQVPAIRAETAATLNALDKRVSAIEQACHAASHDRQEFEREVLQRLARIEEQLKHIHTQQK